MFKPSDRKRALASIIQCLCLVYCLPINQLISITQCCGPSDRKKGAEIYHSMCKPSDRKRALGSIIQCASQLIQKRKLISIIQCLCLVSCLPINRLRSITQYCKPSDRKRPLGSIIQCACQVIEKGR